MKITKENIIQEMADKIKHIPKEERKGYAFGLSPALFDVFQDAISNGEPVADVESEHRGKYSLLGVEVRCKWGHAELITVERLNCVWHPTTGHVRILAEYCGLEVIPSDTGISFKLFQYPTVANEDDRGSKEVAIGILKGYYLGKNGKEATHPRVLCGEYPEIKNK